MNIIIIPAYEPDQKLNQLVDELFVLNLKQILIVDDGSSTKCKPIFNNLEQKGCTVLYHKINMGKGAAIKTGITYAYHHMDQLTGYITCDADGQHQSSDILNVSRALDEHPNTLILGTRDLTGKGVPTKSRLGNKFSSIYFKLDTKITCKDTQTGLRGIPVALTNDALQIKENRYDYEMTFLTEIAKKPYPIVFVPIQTTYLEDNKSSHFKPFVDSYRIYKRPLRFAISSGSCAVVDLGLFTILTFLLNQNIFVLVLLATLIARIISGILNFLLNRNWSFSRHDQPIKKQFNKYFILYILQLILSITFVYLLSFLPINLTVIKLVVDSILFIGSFFIQKNWVFNKS